MDADRASLDEASEAVSPGSAARRLSRLARGRLGGWSGWAAVAALVPLVALLGLQYLWLERLERASATPSGRPSTTSSRRSPPASRCTTARSASASSTCRRRSSLPSGCTRPPTTSRRRVTGRHAPLRRRFLGEKAGWPGYYDPASASSCRCRGREERAVYMAIAPWKILASQGGPLDEPTLSGRGARPCASPDPQPDHRRRGQDRRPGRSDRRRRAVREGRPARARADALPVLRAGEPALPVVSGRDGAARALFGDGESAAGRAAEATHHLTFLFRDWEIEIHSRQYTPAGWARRNFAINLALSVLLAAVVAGGVALRAARGLAGDEAVADEERLRLQRLARAAHAARLDPRLRRAAAPGQGRVAGEGPRSTASTSRPRAGGSPS